MLVQTAPATTSARIAVIGVPCPDTLPTYYRAGPSTGMTGRRSPRNACIPGPHSSGGNLEDGVGRHFAGYSGFTGFADNYFVGSRGEKLE
jgi:hypothetical protein